jgi:hypothetical protein
MFGNGYNFDTRIGPANQALRFYEFQLLSYRKAVDSWTIVGVRNAVVKDVRKIIGKMIWDAREEAAYLKRKMLSNAKVFLQRLSIEQVIVPLLV